MRATESGISMVEILVALAVSLFLLAGIYTTYLSNRKSFLYADGLARLQENARFTIQRLNHDVRMTGYIGCARLKDIPAADIAFSKDTVIAGWRNKQSTSSMPLPQLIQQRAVSDSDILLIQWMDPDSVEVTQVTDHQIKILGKTAFKTNDIVMLSNCLHGDIFKIMQVNYHKPFTLLTIAKTLTHADYAARAQIGELLTRYYYIAATSRKNQAGDTIFALYMQENNSTKPAELAEGVEKMRLKFGVESADHGKIIYLSADQITDWSVVISVDIDLLFDSIESISDKSRSYEFDHIKYLSSDKRLRKEINTVIALRERLL